MGNASFLWYSESNNNDKEGGRRGRKKSLDEVCEGKISYEAGFVLRDYKFKCYY